MYLIDFRLSPHNLFSGPEHGKQELRDFLVPSRRHDNLLKIQARDGQLITSSYFYGMLQNIIPILGETAQEVEQNSNVESLSVQSRAEFYRAVRRTLNINKMR